MFGESESESPRVSSPWDRVLASSPSVEKVYYSSSTPMPCLTAEVEEGNIEYKLHLIQPSPARFARLVTQLKWRLLEGGGQAIYELGVADSGALVGLTPPDLSATLSTLQAMAAEIGARVVVMKQIEVVGMGTREEDKREFARKRRDRDREKDRAVSKARTKVKWQGTPGSTSSFEPSSLEPSSLTPSFTSSVPPDDGISDDAGMPALDSSLSTSSSPRTGAVPTPPDGEPDESIALFAMDDELASFTQGDTLAVDTESPTTGMLPAATVRRSALDATLPTTATVTIPAGAISIPLPLPLTKAARRRITRDIRRAERQKALMGDASSVPPVVVQGVDVVDENNTAPAVEDIDNRESIDQLTDELATFKIQPASRMIVEAMVMRELELGEAFLDFAHL